MQEHVEGEEAENIWKLNTKSINLTLTADNRNHKVNKRHQINICRLRVGEVILVGIKFNVMEKIVVNNELEKLRI
jgi:hypothetical protein